MSNNTIIQNWAGNKEVRASSYSFLSASAFLTFKPILLFIIILQLPSFYITITGLWNPLFSYNALDTPILLLCFETNDAIT